MSDTIWVRRKSRVGNDDLDMDSDHSLFCMMADELDKLADFFDMTDLQFNMSEEELPESWIAENEKWFSPADALPALVAITDRVKAGEVKGIKEKQRTELVEELDDCIEQVKAALRENDRFHFCVVM